MTVARTIMRSFRDPRCPNELRAFKQLPPTADDQTPGALLLLSKGFGMSALLLKVQQLYNIHIWTAAHGLHVCQNAEYIGL